MPGGSPPDGSLWMVLPERFSMDGSPRAVEANTLSLNYLRNLLPELFLVETLTTA